MISLKNITIINKSYRRINIQCCRMGLPLVLFNSTYPKGGVSCSKDSFVVNRTLVFQIKFCGKSPALRVAANRYACFNKKLTPCAFGAYI